MGFWKSHVIKKSCQVTRLRFVTWDFCITCDFQNPILTFPTHSIYTLIPIIFGIGNWFWMSLLALFDTSPQSPLHLFLKFNNFFRVSWFLGEDLSNFSSPDLKLHNRYWHNLPISLSLKKRFYLFAVSSFHAQKAKCNFFTYHISLNNVQGH